MRRDQRAAVVCPDSSRCRRSEQPWCGGGGGHASARRQLLSRVLSLAHLLHRWLTRKLPCSSQDDGSAFARMCQHGGRRGVRGATGFKASTLATIWNAHHAGLHAAVKLRYPELMLAFFMVGCAAWSLLCATRAPLAVAPARAASCSHALCRCRWLHRWLNWRS